jgi:N-acyl-D-aspartate/D-glutamate deacylase
MADLTITGGCVVDGSGAPAVVADVAIEGGRVAEIGPRLPRDGAVLDAGGLLVTPGFIDIHTHDDFTLPLRPEAEARLRQGVTTTVTGNCGFSPFPLDGSAAARRHGAFFEPALDSRWQDLSSYAEELEARGLGVNVAPLVGLGAIRLAVVGEDDRPPSAGELVEMRELTRAALRHGAFGASSGLVYAPGCYATAAELGALAAEVGRAGGFYATHMRDEAGRLEAAVAEAIQVGSEGDCAVQISHHKAIGRANWGKVRRTLAMVEAATEHGMDITLDAYPYTAGSSTLLSLVPAEHQVGGVEALQARLAEPAERAAVIAAIEEERVFALADTVIAAAPSRPDLDGVGLVDAAERDGVRAAELVVDLIRRDGLGVVMVAFGMSGDDVDRVLGHPLTMVGSDGWVLATDASPHPHPRNFSCTARLLTAFVRDRPVLELPAAIRKLTALPARRLGLADRGLLAPGAVADVTIVDLDGLRDLATFDDPSAYPEGIRHVLIAGRPALADGRPTGLRLGEVLPARGSRGGER